MSTITETLSAEHRRCDEEFAELEACVSEEDWSSAESRFEQYRDAVAAHLDFEEQYLFPAYERVSGGQGGPTAVMVQEHQDMRALLDELQHHLEIRDREEFLGVAETLLILTQQHNVKEEQVLYPEADQALPPGESSTLIQRLARAAQ